jgi:hypothetical protein
MITHASAQYPLRAPFEVRELMAKAGRAVDHGLNSSNKSIESKAQSFGSCRGAATACAPRQFLREGEPPLSQSRRSCS